MDSFLRGGKSNWALVSGLLGLCLAGYPHSSFAADQVGIVLVAKGQVTANGRALARKSPFNLGDVISTGTNSEAQLRFIDGTLFTVKPDTKFKVNEYSLSGDPANNKGTVTLVSGGLQSLTGAINKGNPDAFKLNTPVATIGIRGTNLDITVASNTVVMSVSEGEAAVGDKTFGPGSPTTSAILTQAAGDGAPKIAAVSKAQAAAAAAKLQADASGNNSQSGNGSNSSSSSSSSAAGGSGGGSSSGSSNSGGSSGSASGGGSSDGGGSGSDSGTSTNIPGAVGTDSLNPTITNTASDIETDAPGTDMGVFSFFNVPAGDESVVGGSQNLPPTIVYGGAQEITDEFGDVYSSDLATQQMQVIFDGTTTIVDPTFVAAGGAPVTSESDPGTTLVTWGGWFTGPANRFSVTDTTGATTPLASNDNGQIDVFQMGVTATPLANLPTTGTLHYTTVAFNGFDNGHPLAGLTNVDLTLDVNFDTSEFTGNLTVTENAGGQQGTWVMDTYYGLVNGPILDMPDVTGNVTFSALGARADGPFDGNLYLVITGDSGDYAAGAFDLYTGDLLSQTTGLVITHT